MLLPPQQLSAAMNNGTIVITWTIGPTSETPTSVTVTLTNNAHSLQKTASGAAPVEFTVASGDVAQFAGSQVAIYVAFVVAPKGEHAMASTSLDVPGTAPPSPNPPPPGHNTVPPPTGLGVTWDSSTHSVDFHWQNDGPESSGDYDKVLVLWGVQGAPLEQKQQIEFGRGVSHVKLGPVYPNTGYHFQVEGGVSQGLFGGYTYSGWAELSSVSPAGSMPFVGWYKNWFQIHPEAPLQPASPRMEPGRSVTALWRNGADDLHVDLFLEGGIPTMGETWSAWWQPNVGWQPWFNVANAIWAPNLTGVAGSEVCAVWRPQGDRHLDLFATAHDGTVWSTWWEQGPGWQTWFPIHAETHMAPGAKVTAAWRPNGAHLDLFVSSASGALGVVWSTWWEPDQGWQPWFTVSDAVWSPNVSVHPGSHVTALWRPTGAHLDLFAAANDGSVWSTWWENDPGWSQWFAIDVKTHLAAGSPVTAVWSSATVLEIFGSLEDGTAVTAWWEAVPGWHTWVPIDPAVTLQPGAAITAMTAMEIDRAVLLFAAAADGVVWSTARGGLDPKTSWDGWQAIRPAPPILSGATICAIWRPRQSADPNHLDLFTRGTDGSVWSIWFEPHYYE